MNRLLALLTVVTVLFLAIPPASAKDIEKEESFRGIKSIDIQTVSGDFLIKASDSDEVRVAVKYSVHPSDSFKPEMRKSGSELKIREEWYGSSSGSVSWTLSIPQGTEVEFESASGDLDVESIETMFEASTASGEISMVNIKGEYEVSTASGDITIRDGEGEFEVSCASGEINATGLDGHIDMETASGDIEIDESAGTFELSCASGDIEAREIDIEGESSFSAASGDVEVKLGTMANHNLDLGTASGNITLDLNGNALKGTLKVEFRKGKGKVNSPFNFEKEETVTQNGKAYTRLIYSGGADIPIYKLHTASGRITIVK
jgi:DUF4097 and DUF4098 domain-containing protein YvlB